MEEEGKREVGSGRRPERPADSALGRGAQRTPSLVTVTGITVIGIVCTVERNLTFAEKVSLIWLAIFSVRVLCNPEGPVTESMHLRDFFPAVLLAAFLSLIGALLGA